MKINIDGDIGKEDLLKIGTFLTDLYHGRKEHIDVDIVEGLEHMSKEEILELGSDMFGDKLHFTKVIKIYLILIHFYPSNNANSSLI